MQQLLSDKNRQLLVDIGLITMFTNEAEKARPIFEFFAKEEPSQPFGAIGKARLEMINGNPEAALEVLRNNGRDFDEQMDNVKVFMLFALKQAGRNIEADRLAEEMTRLEGSAREAALIYKSQGI